MFRAGPHACFGMGDIDFVEDDDHDSLFHGHNSLIHGHDDEWSLMGRHDDAERRVR